MNSSATSALLTFDGMENVTIANSTLTHIRPSVNSIALNLGESTNTINQTLIADSKISATVIVIRFGSAAYYQNNRITNNIIFNSASQSGCISLFGGAQEPTSPKSEETHSTAPRESDLAHL